MGAFTVALVLMNIWVWRGNRAIKHGFLGAIVTLLFFTLCHHGYEMVNWSLLGLVLLFLLVPLFIRIEYDRDSCEICECC